MSFPCVWDQHSNRCFKSSPTIAYHLSSSTVCPQLVASPSVPQYDILFHISNIWAPQPKMKFLCVSLEDDMSGDRASLVRQSAVVNSRSFSNLQYRRKCVKCERLSYTSRTSRRLRQILLFPYYIAGAVGTKRYYHGVGRSLIAGVRL